MASDTQIKQRTAYQLDRLVKTANRIAKRLPDIEAPEIQARHRYPEMLPLLQMTALADFLDAVDGAIKGEGYAATADAIREREREGVTDETPEEFPSQVGETAGEFAPLPDATDETAGEERISEPVAKPKRGQAP